MNGQIQSLWRYPVKGFTPERLEAATLAAGAFFPCDRLYAVEDGPSGFDPAAPAFVPKQRFTVLAKIPDVARVRTAYDEATGQIEAVMDGQPVFHGDLASEPGREAFAAWLSAALGDLASGPLKVVQAPGHRFTDHPLGFVSIINLASVRDLEAKVGRPVDPLRFRANLYVEGWPAWSELDLVGATLSVGATVRLKVVKRIVRCAATDVQPGTGIRDTTIPQTLMRNLNHADCGIYAEVIAGGSIVSGDRIEVSGED